MGLVNRLRDPLQYLDYVYDTIRSHSLPALTHRSIVWDVHDLASDQKGMFVGDITLQLQEFMPLYYEPTLRIVLMFDEFNDVCNISRLTRADLKEPYILDAFRKFRKRGLSFLVGTHNPFSVPRVVLSNIDCFWMAFRPTEGYSARLLSENLALNREQTEYMMHMTKRNVVCRTKDYPRAFLGDVGEINLPIATDEEIATRIEQTRRVLDSLLEHEPDQLSLFSQQPTPEQAETLFGYYGLTKACLDYLGFLARQPHLFLPINELNELDSFTDYKANSIREQLKDTGPGLIRIHQVRTGKKGGLSSVVQITEAGYHLLSKLGVRCVHPAGNGSIPHKFWQHTIYRWAIGMAFPAKIEQWLNGKSVDVGIEWDERKVALEIALENMEKEISNLIRDLETGWDKVVFAALTDNDIKQLQNEIANRFGTKLLKEDKVGFMKLSTFLEVKKASENADPQSED